MLHGLLLSAQFENIASLDLTPSMPWCFLIKCTSCQEQHPTEVQASLDEEVDMPGSRGSAHLVMKCQFCRRDMSLSLDQATWKSYTQDDAPRMKQLAAVDIRGMEIVQWIPRDGFIANAESGSVFDEVDLSDEYADYDEKSSLPVGITEVSTSIQRIK